MYGGRQEFEGRITGFTMGTGQTLALLPPQNATGNFVKIVQRLPVRIELTDYDPDKTPLFVGLSVAPVRVLQGAADRAARREVLADRYRPLQPIRRASRVSTASAPARRRNDHDGGRCSQPADQPAGGQPLARRRRRSWCPRSWRCWTPPSPTSRCATSPAACRRRSTDSEWVITSYLAANAIILPITGWLSAHLGRRNYFLLSIAVFTLASALCGMATSLEQMILFRVIQGLAGGGLQPSSQGVLLDGFPPEKQGTAMTLFGVAALLAPVVGPTLGGWITGQLRLALDLLHQRPGRPAGACCVLLRWSRTRITSSRSGRSCAGSRCNFDYIGLGLLALVMVCWEIMLSKGQEWDWLSDPFWRVQTLVVLFVVGLVALIFREMRIANPVVNFRPLGERNFAACCIIIFCAFAVLYGASTSLPALLQSLFGYDASAPGWCMSPAGFFSVLVMLFVGRAPWPGDRRPLADRRRPARHGGRELLDGADEPGHQPGAGGLAARGADRRPVDDLRACERGGLPQYTTAAARGGGRPVRVCSATRGAASGTSMAQTIQERREQFHTLRLGEILDPFNPHVASFLEQARGVFLQQTGDPAAAQQMAWQALENLRQQQAASLAYFDVFWLFAVVTLVLVLVVLLMKRSVAEKGAHIGHE